LLGLVVDSLGRRLGVRSVDEALGFLSRRKLLMDGARVTNNERRGHVPVGEDTGLSPDAYGVVDDFGHDVDVLGDRVMVRVRVKEAARWLASRMQMGLAEAGRV
jgi:hypothetical protein